MLFKWGSGTGSNLPACAKRTPFSRGGGPRLGPAELHEGASTAFAGVIKSGGKTRRAAKMVILNVDHFLFYRFLLCSFFSPGGTIGGGEKLSECRSQSAQDRQHTADGRRTPNSLLLDGEALSALAVLPRTHTELQVRASDEFCIAQVDVETAKLVGKPRA